MRIVVFEDAQVEDLYPITIGRPAWAVSCGSFRLIDQLHALAHPVHAVVRPHLQPVVEFDYPDLVQSAPGADEPALFVNARLAPSAAVRRQLAKLIQDDRPGAMTADGTVLVALRPAGGQPAPAELTVDSVAEYLDGLSLPPLEGSFPILDYPHDVLRHHLTSMVDNLETRIAEGGYREVADGVLAAGEVSLGAHATVDSGGGPILLEAGARIGPYCFLQGPAHIGAGARVIEHAAIKDCVSIGHTAKVGGEVEASIIEPYSNKQHHGFIGHSYLGSWINLGAGTCNSDLKNTYGTVNMEYRGRKVPTGMQFVGAIMGDYVKTAINTGVFTGKTVGVCSMVYGYVTTNVPSFVNYARLFGQVTATPVEVLVATQARMFARRNVTQRPCDIQLMHEMFRLTSFERELGSVPHSQLSL